MHDHSDCKSREQLLAELDALQRQVAEMKHTEERGRQAEEALRALEARNRLLRECAPMGVFAVDDKGRVTTINRKMKEMLDLAEDGEDEVINIFQVLDLSQSSFADMIRCCLETKEAMVFERSVCGSEGPCERLRYHLSAVSDSNGSTLGAIAFGEDVTELNHAEQALRESEKRYRLLFQSAPIAMIERDASALKAHIEHLRASGVSDFREYVAANPEDVSRCMSMIKTVSCNGAFLELMEIPHEVALSNGFGMAVFEGAAELAREIVLMLAEGGKTNEKERTFTTLKGNKKSVVAKTLVLSGHEDTFSRIVIAFMDISRRKQAEESLRLSEQRFREQAMRDDLTGLYNRRFLYRTLEALIESAKAEGSQVSVIFMDIDRFKHVVDTYGHLNGSQAIREVAATIGGCVKSPGYAVAYAGDEFVVVLPGSGGDAARQQAVEIRDGMNREVYLREAGIEVRLQASFGVATFPDHARDMTGLLGAADHALFTVKQTGKNGIKLSEGQSLGTD